MDDSITDLDFDLDKILKHIAQERRTHIMVLPAEAFRRYDETPDEEFYKIPRLVTQINASNYKTS